MLGPQPYGETMELIGRAVAVVNTSTFEGMPNVFLESWMRGVPVLSLQVDPDGIISHNGSASRPPAPGSASRRAHASSGRRAASATSSRPRLHVRRESGHAPRPVGARWSELIAEMVPPRNGHRVAA